MVKFLGAYSTHKNLKNIDVSDKTIQKAFKIHKTLQNSTKPNTIEKFFILHIYQIY